ncbi:MAG: bifunctional UDP-N-acetylmuramoyl-tripeptide:D-alanyl-D-alanine ligase/alanine racemase [Bacteroidetes bacterium]|nr:bifunctional UDP-N-acetylmuramoyl-tripeptide:D-alanyl-D-alanine ligase/alanine racemase [Bacteroidota bacterium]
MKDLQKSGVRTIVISNRNYLDTWANYIVVEDTGKALQRFAIAHRKAFDIKTIGITGSNGKTMTKEWLYQLLYKNFNVVRSPKSFNSQIGVPLSVSLISEVHNLALFEAGISQPGEMEHLEKIIQPQIGILTGIGNAHDEGFANRLQKISEKLNLFRNCEWIVYHHGDKDVDEILDALCKENKTVKLFGCSAGKMGILQHISIRKDSTQTIISAMYHTLPVQIAIPFIDDASISNCILCWATLLLLKLDFDLIAELMKQLHPIEMRLQMLSGVNNCIVINDSYNSDINSLRIALNYMKQHQHGTRSCIILSDMMESAKHKDNLYGEIFSLLKENKIDRKIFIGSELSRAANENGIKSECYDNTESFLSTVNTNDFNNEIILIKGARVFEFERISYLLQEKNHDTVLEVNLTALVYNFNFYKAKLNPEVKTMCMVKAFAYGGGSFEIANILAFHKADYLAVAYTDEGVELRNRGITLPLMVMNSEVQSFRTLADYNLEPELYSIRMIQLYSDFVRMRQDNKTYGIHLKFDTGMHRLGLLPDEIEKAIVLLASNPKLKVISVMSHLAASEQVEYDNFTLMQMDKFVKMSSQISDALGYQPLRHICNSSAAIRFTHAQYDMVRLGIGLHGAANTAEETANLLPVSTFKTRISQIKKVNKGEVVGYGCKTVATSDIRIAVIAVGYADGLSRECGNGAYTVLVNNVPCSTIGNICMDMCMIDVTNVTCNEGDEVIIFGRTHSIHGMAKAMRTIPYEVLTGISQRVKRVYLYE